ncbi:hypothetical protein [Bradyrhizobium sp. USDA 377]
MLRRIPAVEWALTRLRPSPHGGNAAPIAADDLPALVVDAAETAPAPNVGISADPLPSDAAIAVAADEAAISVVADSPSAAPVDVSVTDDSLQETPTEVGPVVVAEAAISPVDVAPEPTDIPEPIVDNDPPAEHSADVAPGEPEQAAAASVKAESESVDAEPEPIAISSDPSPEPPAGIAPVIAEETEVVSVDVAIAPVDALIVNDDHSSGIPADVEPVVADAPCVALAGSDVPVEDVSESCIDSAPTSSVAIEIEPIPATDPAPVVVAVVTESSSDDAPGVAADIAPDLAPAAPEVRSAPKVRAKAAEPADRAALIRQRWAETGIRMWNPRLHGTGDATLNIQGSIELLPPAPGETMPRYDKLEFRMLGGQIVCEGVIVEAPVQAGHRSFTRLAEPRVPDRAREPARERQAALA